MEKENIVLFDGVCNLCDGLVQFLIKRDRKFKLKFASLQSEIGASILQKHHLPLQNFESFVYIRKGKLFQKSSAGLLVLFDLGGIWRLLLIFYIIPWFIRDWVYLLVSKNRYRIWGKKESCMMPDPKFKARFL
jgi:predicted DCC family thiol-disulfide oxidoreductase YuxK